MKKIHKLDAVTISQIAAGEVVERPSSVVKELCENSIDAGASRIFISTVGGGIKEIEVIDDGSGMSADDALDAFEEHATSKLSDISGLESISSMGFRGEALPTIASVSKLTLLTRERGQDRGTRVYAEGGEILEQLPAAVSEGTKVKVRELFYNTPARYKFLKKDTSEAARITVLVQHLALSRPDIGFRLKHGGNEVLNSPGNGDLRSAVYAVCGKNEADSAVFFEEEEKPGAYPVKMGGALGLPLSAKRSRRGQYIFVNNRAVESPLITRALEDAYSGRLMHGQHPFAVLKLKIAPNLIDVNVHPQKKEIRFVHEQQIYSYVMKRCREILEKNINPQIKDSEPEPAYAVRGSEVYEPAHADPEYTAYQPHKATEYSKFQNDDKPYSGMKVVDEHRAERGQSFNGADKHETDISNGFSAHSEYKGLLHFSENQAAADVKTDIQKLAEGEFKAVLFRTYIVIESGPDFFLIDQHAAHERILYEQLLGNSESENKYKNNLLVPAELELNPEQREALIDNYTIAEEMGFSIEKSEKGRIKLNSVPLLLKDLSPQQAAEMLAEELIRFRYGENSEMDKKALRKGFAMRACKAAVKAGNSLSEGEIKELISKLCGLENPFQCPHGRPTFIKISEKRLEKLFKRIV